MHCYVYKGARRDDHYIYLLEKLEEGLDLPESVPQALWGMLGDLSFVVEFDLNEKRKLPQADSRQVLDTLAEQGFYLQMPKKDMVAVEDQLFS